MHPVGDRAGAQPSWSDFITGPVTTTVLSLRRSTAFYKAERHSSFHCWCHLLFNLPVLQRLCSWNSVSEVLLCSQASASLFTVNLHLSLNRETPLELWAIYNIDRILAKNNALEEFERRFHGDSLALAVCSRDQLITWPNQGCFNLALGFKIKVCCCWKCTKIKMEIYMEKAVNSLKIKLQINKNKLVYL